MNVEHIDGLASLWSQTQGHPQVSVAVLDGQPDCTHPCLENADLTFSRLWPRSPEVDTSMMGLHGTHVASILFGRGEVKGVSPGCRGYVIPLLPSKRRPVPQLDLARAIEEAIENGCQIINVSAGQYSDSGTADDWLLRAAELCHERKVLLVAAAGNDGCECLHVPASLPGCLAVGALDWQGDPLDFSNWGERYLENGILAPGKDILGASPEGGTRRLSGTSFAAPILSGIAALLLSLMIEQGKDPDPRLIGRALLDGALKCNLQDADACRRWLVGKLSIAGALSQLDKLHNPGAVYLVPLAVEAQDEALPPEPPAPPVVEEPVPTEPPAPVVSPPAKPMPRSLVFALGGLELEFPSQAVEEEFHQQLGVDPHDLPRLLAYLEEHSQSLHKLTWVFTREGHPHFVIQPSGEIEQAIYERLLALKQGLSRVNHPLERMSLPGLLTGERQTLRNGQSLPVVRVTQQRCLFGWSNRSLVEGLGPDLEGRHPGLRGALLSFLDKIYGELENPGIQARHRALNFAATNLFQASESLVDALHQDFELHSVEAQKSPFCRLNSECWDVVLKFYDPEHSGRAYRVSRFTIDVSDMTPVTLGSIRAWASRR